MEVNNVEKCDCSESLCCCGRLVEQSVSASTAQDESVVQGNVGLQIAAIAIALNGATVKVSQQNCQSNSALQKSFALAEHCESIECENICADSEESNSAMVAGSAQSTQGNSSLQGIDAAIKGSGTEIERTCREQSNTFVESGLAIFSNCRLVPAAQPDNITQKDINSQYHIPEDSKSVLDQTPLAAITINGKEIQYQPQTKERTIKQVAFNEDNVNKKPLVLNFEKFHVTLNLEGTSLGIEADTAGHVLVDGKGVRL